VDAGYQGRGKRWAEEVARRWAEEWAKEGKEVDWQRLMHHGVSECYRGGG